MLHPFLGQEAVLIQPLVINMGMRCELPGDSLDSLPAAPHNSYFVVCDRQLRVWTEGEEMRIKEAFVIALRAVRAHRLRSALTMLGLIIGVSTVVLLSACGLGVRNSVDARIEPISNNITTVPKTAHVPGVWGLSNWITS